MIVTLSMDFRVSFVFLYTVTSFLNLLPYSCNVYTSVFFVFVCFCMLMVINIFRKEHQNKKQSQKMRLPNGCPQNVFTAKQSELSSEDVEDLLKSHARRSKKSADIKNLVAPLNKPHVVSMVFTLANRKEHYWKNDEKHCFSWRARRKKN
jgi:Ca2+/Na+ antiporter